MCWDVFRWAKDVCFNPGKNTKKDYKYGDFIKRLAIVSLVSGVLTTVIAAISFNELAATQGQEVAVISVAIGIPIFLFSALIGPFVNAAVTHFFGKLVFRLMKKDYKKTYNATAYSMVPRFLFAWIPVIGGVVAAIWGLIVQIYALANQQHISKARALLIVFIPIIIAFIILLAVFATGISYLGGIENLKDFSTLGT